jgi:hypothetical protein
MICPYNPMIFVLHAGDFRNREWQQSQYNKRLEDLNGDIEGLYMAYEPLT